MNEKEMKNRKEKAIGLKVFRLEENLYGVESSNGDKFYKVQKEGDNAICYCPDFQRHCGEDGWKCKHILAVENFLENCPELATSHSSRQCMGMNRKLLEAPFESSQIRQRKGAFGDVLDYVEGHAVIRRLNDAFDDRWSFEVVDHKILQEEVVVLARLEAEGISKMQFGSCKMNDPSRDNSPMCLGDALKAAATDALKKAATHFGVGLHLYEEKNTLGNSQNPQIKGPSEKPEERSPDDNQRPERLTNKQLTAIYSIARDKGISSKEMEQRVLKVFGKKPEYLSKQEASDVIKQLKELEAEVPSTVKEKGEAHD